jgi:hypothetical protein
VRREQVPQQRELLVLEPHPRALLRLAQCVELVVQRADLDLGPEVHLVIGA